MIRRSTIRLRTTCSSKATSREKSLAQIEAFEDAWRWDGGEAEAFDEVMHSKNTDVAEMLRSMRPFLDESDVMAYLCVMAVRLLELRRALKPTGSIYHHCDPTASHYLKILMDAIFGAAYKPRDDPLCRHRHSERLLGLFPERDS